MNKIVVVVDRSGSMGFLRNDVIGGFNTFLQSQKELGDDATMTVVLFDNEYEFYTKDAKLSQVEPFTDSTYVPRGSTALLDALGRAITETLARRSDDKVMVVVITDGQENASVEWKKDKIMSLIDEKKNAGWEFMFLSSDLNAVQDAQAYGFGTTVSFQGNSRGIMDMYHSMGTQTTIFRGYKVDEDKKEN